MKISINSLAEGVSKYIDTEFLPALPTKQRWIVTAAAFVGLSKLPDILGQLPILAVLGLIDEDSNVDIDAALAAVKQACQKHGKLAVEIPMLGTINLAEKDFDKLYKLVMAEAPETAADETEEQEEDE